jgi:hypothetical protein
MPHCAGCGRSDWGLAVHAGCPLTGGPGLIQTDSEQSRKVRCAPQLLILPDGNRRIACLDCGAEHTAREVEEALDYHRRFTAELQRRRTTLSDLRAMSLVSLQRWFESVIEPILDLMVRTLAQAIVDQLGKIFF